MNLALEFIWMHWTAAAFYVILCSPIAMPFSVSLLPSLFHCIQQTSSLVLFLHWCCSSGVLSGSLLIVLCSREEWLFPIEWEATCPWLCSICAQWLDQLFRGEWSLVQCLPSLYLTWRFFLYFHLSLSQRLRARASSIAHLCLLKRNVVRVYGLYYIDRTKVRSPREKSQWSLAKQQSAREQSYVHGMYDMNTK